MARLAHVCPIGGCPELVPFGQARCAEHGGGPSDRSTTRTWGKLRAAVLERDVSCQAPVAGARSPCRGPLAAHHLIPFASGRADEEWKLVACCSAHNSRPSAYRFHAGNVTCS